jgi:glycosyltransferase involved in cell wall biosynthesis
LAQPRRREIGERGGRSNNAFRNAVRNDQAYRFTTTTGYNVTPAPVTAVIPVYNGERYLAEAIQSMLTQTRPAAQIIIVDDGSEDSSADIAASFGDAITLIRQENQGVAAARNSAIATASQPYVAWLDHDDVAMAERLELQLAAFDLTPTPDIVFGGMGQFISPELPSEVASRLRCDERVQPAPLPSCFMAPIGVFDTVGKLRTDTDATFVDWYLRAMEQELTFSFVPDLIVRRRIHNENQSYQNDALRRDYIRMIKASLDRRRRSAADVK